MSSQILPSCTMCSQIYSHSVLLDVKFTIRKWCTIWCRDLAHETYYYIASACRFDG